MPFYSMPDGSTIHLNCRGTPPTQDAVEEWWRKDQAKKAARDPEDVAYGEVLVRRRLAANKSLRETAKGAGLSPVEFSAIERGRATATPEQRAAIDHALFKVAAPGTSEDGSGSAPQASEDPRPQPEAEEPTPNPERGPDAR